MSAGLSALMGAVNWFVLLAAPVAVAVLVAARIRYRGISAPPRRRVTWLDLAVAWSVLAIATVTLLPDDPPTTGLERGMQLRPLASIVTVLTQSVSVSVPIRLLLFNVVLFVPLGVGLALRMRGVWAPIGVALLVSLTVETAQALLPLGRTANVDDVLLNTLGAAVGLAAVRVPARRRREQRGESANDDASAVGPLST